MGVNPLFPLAIIVGLRLIIAVVNGAAASNGNLGNVCDLDANGQCKEPSLLHLVADYALGQIDGAPAGINFVVGVISFIFLAWFVLAVYVLIRSGVIG